MNAVVNEDGTPKKKSDKPDNKSVNTEKKESNSPDKGEEEPKPRIVLTFRSEKNSARSSNMKIVTTEEKHEEAPRRSSRTRAKWEWICDSDTSTSPKKEKSAQNTSENDESDSSHSQKRSTRRRSKDSENILANAIARKEKSYETQAAPQRLSRRIKPTAKVLANEELRIGVESQNNARLGVADKSPEEGVRTRRSTRQGTDTAWQPVAKKTKPLEAEEVVEIGTDDDSQSQPDDMKLKHLCELGLKAVDSEAAEESGDEIREDVEDEAEDLEDDEIDDDPGVISSLLKTFDGAESDESSDEEFQCEVTMGKKKRPRRSTRLMSSYGMNDSDQSLSGIIEEEQKSSVRRKTNRSQRPSRRRQTSSGVDEERSDDVDLEQISNPADGEEGSEAACPNDESSVIATCYCEAPSNVHAAPDDLTEPVFCQAVELVDDIRVGCSHRALQVCGTLAPLRRAGPRAPYFLACRLHAAQLDKHMCCPGCGLFCTQGTFYMCNLGHLFHIECGLPLNENKQKPGCPHCGVYSYRWEPVNLECVKVNVQMSCSNKRIFLTEQKEHCTPAYPSFSSTEHKQELPMIPEDLLPLNTTRIKELLHNIESFADSPEELCDAIVKGVEVEDLIPKLVSSSIINSPVAGERGGTCAHAAARRGARAALCAVHCAGARLDATDDLQRTPVLVAVLALVGKLKEEEPHIKEQEGMEVDPEQSENAEESKNEIAEENKTEQEIVGDEEKPNEEDLLKVIQYLIIAGCDVNHQGPEQKTALHICSQYGHVRGASYLVPVTDLNVKDMGGWTALVWAAENNYTDIVKMLLSAGADPLTTDKEDNSAVHWCAASGAVSSLQEIVRRVPHAINSHNVHGDTPLHIAARQGHYSCVVVLLALGARTDVKNSNGELPVDVCGGQCEGAIALNMQMRRLGEGSARFTLLSSDISRGREPFPIPCVNEVDDTPLPEDFTYVTSHVMPEHVEIDDTIATMQGCQCAEGSCSSSSCACASLCVRQWYSGGRLLQSFPYKDPPMLFECNDTCGCDLRRCGNSVVTSTARHGSVAVRCEVYRSASVGWALRARQAVPRGSLVSLYCGELLPIAAADGRHDDRYVFSLTLNHDLLQQCKHKTQLCVDASTYGSAARFINHSCVANLTPVRVFTRCRDLRLPTVALFACRDIAPGDEFTFDYGDEFWSVKSKWMKCECRSIDCRYPTKASD